MGIEQQVGGRNAPTIINAAYHRAQFWDGRAKNLEQQALGPIENPIEMITPTSCTSTRSRKSAVSTSSPWSW